MKSGKVVSYSNDKKYGFIKSDDGGSYFFHISDVAKDDQAEIGIGSIVKFDDVPGPKGMAAKKVSAVESYPLYESLGDEVIVSKSKACGKGNEVVHIVRRVQVEHEEPDTAVRILKEKAKGVGCNAILNFARSSRAGTAWTNSNYRYSIHQMSGDIALVKKKSRTLNRVEAESNRSELAKEIEAIKGKQNPGDSTVRDFNIMYRIIWGVIVLVVMGAVISGM